MQKSSIIEAKLAKTMIHLPKKRTLGLGGEISKKHDPAPSRAVDFRSLNEYEVRSNERLGENEEYEVYEYKQKSKNAVGPQGARWRIIAQTQRW